MKKIKDIMHIRERQTKNGLSLDLFCSGKDPITKESKTYVKTYRVPQSLNGKKEVEEFRLKCQLEWKSEVEKLSRGLFNQTADDILFYDYAYKWVQNIRIYNPEAYQHYSHCCFSLKVFKEKFGNLKLSEINLPIIQSFCDWLCTRTYKKITVVAKNGLKEYIKSKGYKLCECADSCAISTTTLALCLEEDKHVCISTAKKLCTFLGVPIENYFTVYEEYRQYSQSANKQLKVMLHGILGQAVREGLISVNYASKDYIKPISGTVGKKEIYETSDEIKTFINCIENERDIRKKVAFSIGINLGLRGAEISGLEWKDIDFENALICINKNTMYVSGFGTITKGTKNKSSTRLISIPPHLLELLKGYKEWWIKEKINHGDLWVNTDKLFVQNNGNDMSNATIANWLKNFQKENNLKLVSLHGLRHSNITLLITSGVDIKTVAGRVGHSDTQTTLNIYSHYTKQSDKRASDTIENLLYAN